MSADPNALENRCIWHVARELARPHVPAVEVAPDSFPTEEQLQERFGHWRKLTIEHIPAAEKRINQMTNFQLLKLIGEVISDGQHIRPPV